MGVSSESPWGRCSPPWSPTLPAGLPLSVSRGRPSPPLRCPGELRGRRAGGHRTANPNLRLHPQKGAVLIERQYSASCSTGRFPASQSRRKLTVSHACRSASGRSALSPTACRACECVCARRPLPPALCGFAMASVPSAFALNRNFDSVPSVMIHIRALFFRFEGEFCF